jgi:hypothetical protein
MTKGGGRASRSDTKARQDNIAAFWRDAGGLGGTGAEGPRKGRMDSGCKQLFRRGRMGGRELRDVGTEVAGGPALD